MQFLKKIIEAVILAIGKVHWAPGKMISTAQQDEIRALLKDNYFVILTYRKNHLSSYGVAIANFFLTGRLGKWSHALMNFENTVNSDEDFRLIEATGDGTHFTPFDKVFDVHRVVLLSPTNMTLDEWTGLLDKAKSEVGKPYDSLFNLANENELSCVELVRAILRDQPNYDKDFANFEALIKKRKNLSPQMYYDCPDFKVVYEAKV